MRTSIQMIKLTQALCFLPTPQPQFQPLFTGLETFPWSLCNSYIWNITNSELDIKEGRGRRVGVKPTHFIRFATIVKFLTKYEYGLGAVDEAWELCGGLLNYGCWIWCLCYILQWDMRRGGYEGQSHSPGIWNGGTEICRSISDEKILSSQGSRYSGTYVGW